MDQSIITLTQQVGTLEQYIVNQTEHELSTMIEDLDIIAKNNDVFMISIKKILDNSIEIFYGISSTLLNNDTHRS